MCADYASDVIFKALKPTKIHNFFKNFLTRGGGWTPPLSHGKILQSCPPNLERLATPLYPGHKKVLIILLLMFLYCLSYLNINKNISQAQFTHTQIRQRKNEPGKYGNLSTNQN